MLTTKNQKLQKMLMCQKRNDGQISEGLYLEIESNADTQEIIRVRFGTPEIGPLMAWHESENGWTPLYSRGNYGKNCVSGGHWSTHCNHLLRYRILGEQGPGDKDYEVVDFGGQLMMLDKDVGVKGDAGVTATDLDCSGSWPIYFPTAKQAADNMLTTTEIKRSTLPVPTKKHLLTRLYDDSIGKMRELATAFGL